MEIDDDSNQHCIEKVPVFRNGHKSRNVRPTILTVNTCAFDSVFSFYFCLYFDDRKYRDETYFFVRQSHFCELLQKYFRTYTSKLKVNSSASLAV